MALSAFDRTVMKALLAHVAHDKKTRARVIQAIKESCYPDLTPRSAEIIAALKRIEVYWADSTAGTLRPATANDNG